jgi:hypothetical protein
MLFLIWRSLDVPRPGLLHRLGLSNGEMFYVTPASRGDWWPARSEDGLRVGRKLFPKTTLEPYSLGTVVVPRFVVLSEMGHP